MNKQDDIVTLFRDESGKVIGILVLNGTTEFYKCSKATKDFIKTELLELNVIQ